MTAVSVVIPARDALATLRATLDGLAAQRGVEGFEVIVVDDGSTDGTAALADAHRVGARLLRIGAAGAGSARNAGVAAARAPRLAFTDADCVPEPGWLAAGLAALDADAGLVQGRVVPVRPPGPYDRTVAIERETGLYETANLFVERAWFDAVGGFEDGLASSGRPFGEDAWFAWRVRRAGARTAFAPDAAVVHDVFGGTPASLLAERRRLRHFPALVRRIPELRRGVLYRRVFLSERTAAFDLAMAGAAVALVRRSPVPLVATVPYLRRLAPARRRAPVFLGADAVGAASLLRGSLAARTLVL